MALSTSATSVAGDTRGDMMESAGRLVDKHVSADQSFYELSGLLRVATHSKHRPSCMVVVRVLAQYGVHA